MSERGAAKIMLSVVERLIECIERETAHLSGGNLGDTRAHIATKSRLLFDLNRVIREAGVDMTTPLLTEKLRALRAALDANADALRANMSAMRELVGMVHASALRDNADGTYGRPGVGSAG